MFVLCEVALGSHLNYEDSLYDEKKFPTNNSGFDCIIRLGNHVFGEDDKIEIDSVIGFYGASQYKLRINDPKVTSKYPNFTNEYMVFDEKRINVKAIVKVDMFCYNLNDNYKCRCNYQSPRKN